MKKIIENLKNIIFKPKYEVENIAMGKNGPYLKESKKFRDKKEAIDFYKKSQENFFMSHFNALF